MIVLGFAVNLFAASMLLLFAVRLVRTGAERSFAPQLRRLLQDSGRGLGAALSGFLLAIMLQGSTAVILLTSGLVSTGIVELSTGAAIVIGADIGSSIVVGVLTFELTWLAPVLMALGGWLYLKTSRVEVRNVGRMVLGIALILVSLEMIGTAVAPVRESNLMPELVVYLERDLVLAVLLGVVLTFLLHSSVASILICIALISSGAISLLVGIAFVLGANAGSGLISIWLTRGSGVAERHLPLLNTSIRGMTAIMAFALLLAFRDRAPLSAEGDAVAVVILAHITFNLVLLAFLPLVALLSRLLLKILPMAPSDGANGAERLIGAVAAVELDVGNPVAVLRRDLLVLLDAVSTMISETELLISEHDQQVEESILATEQRVNRHFNHMRAYFSRTTREDVSKSAQRELRQLLEYVVKLEQAADIVAMRIVLASRDMRENQLSFSQEGRAELEQLRRLALSNTFLAFEVVSTWHAETARQLVARKEEFSRLEQKCRQRHFKRLCREGNRVSLESSDMHLEVSTAFKEINSKVATIAYIVLADGGQLADSRLLKTPKHEMS